MARQIGVKEFSKNILGQRVYFHVISMQKSLWLWAGTNISLDSLAVAVQTRFVSDYSAFSIPMHHKDGWYE